MWERAPWGDGGDAAEENVGGWRIAADPAQSARPRAATM